MKQMEPAQIRLVMYFCIFISFYFCIFTPCIVVFIIFEGTWKDWTDMNVRAPPVSVLSACQAVSLRKK